MDEIPEKILRNSYIQEYPKKPLYDESLEQLLEELLEVIMQDPEEIPENTVSVNFNGSLDKYLKKNSLKDFLKESQKVFWRKKKEISYSLKQSSEDFITAFLELLPKEFMTQLEIQGRFTSQWAVLGNFCKEF